MDKARVQFYRILAQAGETAAREFARRSCCTAAVQQWLDQQKLSGLQALPAGELAA